MNGVVLITGGHGAIGQAIAQELIESGHLIVSIDTTEPSIDSVGISICGDISNPQTWIEVSRAVSKLDQPIRAFIHTAYVLDRVSHEEMSHESWLHQIAVNLSSVHLMLATFRKFKSVDPLSLILLSSVHSRIGIQGHSAYAASKGALNALARQLSVEWGPRGRVNSIVLGPVLTPAWDGATVEEIEGATQQTAIKRMGLPRDVAHLAAFLLSEKSDFITGTEIVLDGGFLQTKETR